MIKYILTKQELEQLAWDSVQLYRVGAYSEADVLPKHRARTFRRLAVREYLNTRVPMVVDESTTLGELMNS